MVVFYFAENLQSKKLGKIYLDYYLPEKNGVNLLTSQHKSPDHLVPSNRIKVHHLSKRHSWKWNYNPFSIFMLYEDNESNLCLWFFNIQNVYHNVKGAVTNLLPWYVKLKCLQMLILSSFFVFAQAHFCHSVEVMPLCVKPKCLQMFILSSTALCYKIYILSSLFEICLGAIVSFDWSIIIETTDCF